MFGFSIDAFSLGTAGCPGCFALFLYPGRSDDQFTQTFQRLLTVLFLAAALLRFDHNDAVPGEAAVFEVEQSLLVKIRQGGGPDIETQVNGRGDLVDILSAGAACTDCADLNFMIRYADLAGYEQHGKCPYGKNNILPLLLL